MFEYENANVRKNSVAERAKAKWKAPEAGVVKINLDAAINEEDDRVGLGWVARRSDGSVIKAASKTVWPFLGVERAEIDAFLWAVESGCQEGWQACVFEGDAKVVVDALNGGISRAGHHQVLIENILASSKVFREVSFVFCYREANLIAHRLARWSSSSVCSCVWPLGGPVWIADLVVSDSLSEA